MRSNGCAKDNLTPFSRSVEADYGFLGNQVNIGDNNNKFYRGQVVTSSKGAFARTRWGRV